MNLTQKQFAFISLVTQGQNVFLTGKAGTGKSTVATRAIELLIAGGKKVICCAPTGIAASNIDGQTIHSLFSLKPFGVLTYEECNFVNNAKRDVLRHFDVLIIDEVSMLRPDTLDAMHWTLKKNGLDGLDKKQVIFIGDLKQLPVVLDDNTRSVLYQTYEGDDFMCAHVFNHFSVQTIELDEIMRQTDPEFIEALNIVREGGKSPYFKQFVGPALDDGVILAPHNATVEEYNRLGLSRDAGELFAFTAEINGNAKPQDFALDQFVQTKHGSKIMYLVNSRDNPLRNGTIGTFIADGENFFIRVGLVDYVLLPIEITKKIYIYDKWADKLILQEVGSMSQYPFRLAYALSIHKSQGLTFDKVSVDLRRPCFMKGQLYTALSRVKSPAGLRIVL